MALLLAIETTTKNCSVAIFEDCKLLAQQENNSDRYSHAEQLTAYIGEIIKKSSFTFGLPAGKKT